MLKEDFLKLAKKNGLTVEVLKIEKRYVEFVLTFTSSSEKLVTKKYIFNENSYESSEGTYKESLKEPNIYLFFNEWKRVEVDGIVSLEDSLVGPNPHKFMTIEEYLGLPEEEKDRIREMSSETYKIVDELYNEANAIGGTRSVFAINEFFHRNYLTGFKDDVFSEIRSNIHSPRSCFVSSGEMVPIFIINKDSVIRRPTPGVILRRDYVLKNIAFYALELLKDDYSRALKDNSINQYDSLDIIVKKVMNNQSYEDGVKYLGTIGAYHKLCAISTMEFA